MIAKEELRTELEFKSVGYDGVPASTNHAIYERDNFMVQSADIVYANLMNTKIVSIGTVMELAVASHLRKHTIVAMEKGNIHFHAFVIESADIIYESHEDAIEYLNKLVVL